MFGSLLLFSSFSAFRGAFSLRQNVKLRPKVRVQNGVPKGRGWRAAGEHVCSFPKYVLKFPPFSAINLAEEGSSFLSR